MTGGRGLLAPSVSVALLAAVVLLHVVASQETKVRSSSSCIARDQSHQVSAQYANGRVRETPVISAGFQARSATVNAPVEMDVVWLCYNSEIARGRARAEAAGNPDVIFDAHFFVYVHFTF